MIMRRQSFRRWFVSALVLGGCLTTLAVVSGGRAGSTTDSTFEFLVQPSVLTIGGTGFAKGELTAASGSGTGSATHVVMTFRLPAALIDPSATSSDCSDPVLAGGTNTITCTIGTVNAGVTVTRFVTFTASALGTYTASGMVSLDRGSGGAGGGGSVNTIGPLTDETTVVAEGDSNQAGNCLSGGGSITTPTVNAADTQSTFMSFGAAAFFLPCTWAELGEGQAPEGSRIPQISFVTAPVFANLATLTISIYQLPLSKIGTLLEFPNYPNLSGSLAVLACPSPTSLPPGRDACERPRSKNGNVTLLTLLFSGTGSDPGFGGG